MDILLEGHGYRLTRQVFLLSLTYGSSAYRRRIKSCTIHCNRPIHSLCRLVCPEISKKWMVYKAAAVFRD